eukprot:scaffold1344_cov102-Cylindrotheca_fusiformis.AAC.5
MIDNAGFSSSFQYPRDQEPNEEPSLYSFESRLFWMLCCQSITRLLAYNTIHNTLDSVPQSTVLLLWAKTALGTNLVVVHFGFVFCTRKTVPLDDQILSSPVSAF